MCSPTFERRVKIEAAYDGSTGSPPEWRHESMKPNTNYGVCGCKIFFILVGPGGAVSLALLTDWYAPHVQKRFQDQTFRGSYPQPLATGLWVHMLAPPEPFDAPTHAKCEWLDDQPCWCYEPRGVCGAQDVVREHLLPGGSEALWKELEQVYRTAVEVRYD